MPIQHLRNRSRVLLPLLGLLGTSIIVGCQADGGPPAPPSAAPANATTGSTHGSSGGQGDAGRQDGETNDDLTNLLGSYTPWADPPATAKVMVGAPRDLTPLDVGDDEYRCKAQDYDVTEQFDRVLGLGAAHASVKPGMLLQGNGVQNGVFRPIPLRRAPITISIDLPIKNPVRRIDDPTSDSIQAAIASMQADADAELPSLRSNFTHTTEVVDSFDQATFAFGVDLKYAGPLVSAGLKTTFDQSREAGRQQFAVKHIEELYTITFSDERIATEADFFAPDVTAADVRKVEAGGMLGPSNAPTFVKSVTYGRLVLATASMTNQFDSKSFATAVSGGALGFSGDASVKDQYKAIASSASFNVLALGASTDEAKAALADARIQDMFGAARARTASPLYYDIHFVKSPRLTAKIGSTTRYTAQQCSLVPKACVPGGACASGWTNDGAGTCRIAASASSSVDIYDRDWKLNLNPPGYSYRLPSISGAESTTVCINAKRTGGGLYNDGTRAFDVVCGAARRTVYRNELWANNSSGVTWCWTVPVATSCDVEALGDVWTPWAQSAGEASVSFSVTEQSAPTRCYASSWQ